MARKSFAAGAPRFPEVPLREFFRKKATFSARLRDDARTSGRGEPDDFPTDHMIQILFQMSFEEFQHLARLSVVGALDPDEVEQFEAGRRRYGEKAEAFLKECRKLNAVFALSLQPCEPDPKTKERLFELIRAMGQQPKENPDELKLEPPVGFAFKR
jgi:hypothetical protein